MIRMQCQSKKLEIQLFCYNNLGLCNMLFIILHILRYKLIPHKAHIFLPCLA